MKTDLELCSELSQAIQSDSLKITRRNAAAVKRAYCVTVFWQEAFREAGLSELPDPEGTCQPKVFEDWLVKAYAGNFESPDEARSALHSVRDKVIKQAQK
jgi:hypothetical protein